MRRTPAAAVSARLLPAVLLASALAAAALPVDANVAGWPRASRCTVSHDAAANTLSVGGACSANELREPLRRAIVAAGLGAASMPGDAGTALGYRFRRPPPPEQPGGRYFGQR